MTSFMVLFKHSLCGAAQTTAVSMVIQGYLAHKKLPPHETLQWDYSWSSVEVLAGWVFSYERDTPVEFLHFQRKIQL
jgi:hypothetical protein